MQQFFCIIFAALAATGFSAEAADDLQCIGCVNARDIASGAVRNRHLADGVVDYNKLAQDVRDLIEASLSERRMKLIDSTGAFVGDVADLVLQEDKVTADPDRVLAWVDIADETVLIHAEDTLLTAGRTVDVLYPSPDCSGAPYLRADSKRVAGRGFVVTPDGHVWKALPGTEDNRSISSSYFFRGGYAGQCLFDDGGGTPLLSLTEEIGDISHFVPPFEVVYE